MTHDYGNPSKFVGVNNFRKLYVELAYRAKFTNPDRCTPHGSQKKGITRITKAQLPETTHLDAARHRSMQTNVEYQHEDTEIQDKYYEAMASVPLSNPGQQVCIYIIIYL